MQQSALALSLGFLAVRVSCSPIPIPVVLIDAFEPVPGAVRPHAPSVADRPESTLTQFVINPDESRRSERPGDDTQATPSATANAQPSDILNSPNPLSSTYLLSLSRQGAGAKHEGGYERSDDAPEEARARLGLHVPNPEASPASSYEPETDTAPETEHEGVLAGAPGRGVPCTYASLAKERGDMVAVILVAIFLLLVVVAEVSAALFSWSGVLSRFHSATTTLADRAAAARLSLSRQGSIRLGEEPSRPPLSFYSDAETETCSWEEKTEERAEEKTEETTEKEKRQYHPV